MDLTEALWMEQATKLERGPLAKHRPRLSHTRIKDTAKDTSALQKTPEVKKSNSIDDLDPWAHKNVLTLGQSCGSIIL